MISFFFIPLLFLLGASLTAAFAKAIDWLGPIQGEKEFKAKRALYGVVFLIKRLFPKESWNALSYLLSFSRHLLRLLYAATLSLLLFKLMPTFPLGKIPTIVAIVTGISLIVDFAFFLLVNLFPISLLRTAALPTALFLFLFSPLTFPLLAVQKKLFQRQKQRGIMRAKPQLKDKILELIHESRSTTLLNPIDQRLILSVASFRDRIAREIMVPRIDIFALSADQLLSEAAQELSSQGFSRIPIYRDRIDNIIGVLLYKDVIEHYHKSIQKSDPSILKTPLGDLVKPILYTPETKKISSLLQEFRQKQTHLAIVVDEYGGTEGIVTTEDILEELVGEIADEHDTAEEEKLYTPFPSGGWIVDAKMTILDLEKELGIAIPTSAEYDTIGGFVFHRAGTIPSKGWKLHGDQFDLEVLSSSDRAIEKVMITPRASN
ncbi:MAG: hemolysin family protein [Chlamydiota bacterium]